METFLGGFGQTQAQPTSLFGQQPAATTPTSGFGGFGQPQQTTAFGQPAQQPSGGLFGNTTTPAFGAQPAAQPATTGFGAQANTGFGGFGTPQTQQPKPAFGFGCEMCVWTCYHSKANKWHSLQPPRQRPQPPPALEDLDSLLSNRLNKHLLSVLANSRQLNNPPNNLSRSLGISRQQPPRRREALLLVRQQPPRLLLRRASTLAELPRRRRNLLRVVSSVLNQVSIFEPFIFFPKTDTAPSRNQRRQASLSVALRRLLRPTMPSALLSPDRPRLPLQQLDFPLVPPRNNHSKVDCLVQLLRLLEACLDKQLPSQLADCSVPPRQPRPAPLPFPLDNLPPQQRLRCLELPRPRLPRALTLACPGKRSLRLKWAASLEPRLQRQLERACLGLP